MKLLTIIQNFFLNHSQFKKEKTDFLMLDMTALNKELNEKLPLYIPAQSKIESHASKEGGGSKINQDLKLEDIFESKEKYDLIFDILADEKLVSRETHIWLDHGQGFKAVMISVVKNLQLKGYYSDNHYYTNDEIRHIVYNTFNIEIGIDCIKHTTNDNTKMGFIPLASEIGKIPQIPQIPRIPRIH